MAPPLLPIHLQGLSQGVTCPYWLQGNQVPHSAVSFDSHSP